MMEHIYIFYISFKDNFSPTYSTFALPPINAEVPPLYETTKSKDKIRKQGVSFFKLQQHTMVYCSSL